MSADQENRELNPEIDRQIEETQRAIENTQTFLNHLAESEEDSRQHLKQIIESLRQRLEGLRSHQNSTPGRDDAATGPSKN